MTALAGQGPAGGKRALTDGRRIEIVRPHTRRLLVADPFERENFDAADRLRWRRQAAPPRLWRQGGIGGEPRRAR